MAAAALVTIAAPTRPVAAGLLTFLVYTSSAVAVIRFNSWGRMLPLARATFSVAQSMVGALALWLTSAVFELALRPATIVATAVVADVVRRAARDDSGRRVAVIGTPAVARRLAEDLDAGGVLGYDLVGVIAPRDGSWSATDHDGRLGVLKDLDRLVEEHHIELVLIAESRPETDVFATIAEGFLHVPVRVCQLAQFYELAFGRVAESEIDAAWFRYIMHPHFHSPDTRVKRTLDVVVAGIAALLFAPFVLVLAVLIKVHDGGPVVFRQVRIGRGGRPFTLFKLRTMRVEPEAAAAWSSEHDPRVTPIGRLLRRSHIDELPQVLNVLRGEMSLIGPRPEQPEFVERLESDLRYYSRRHLIKPGLTGWAQVRCGYAGSDSGSAAKLCYDLFYLKHRNFGMDVAILVETMRTLVADRQFPSELTASAAVGDAPAVGVLSQDRADPEPVEEPAVTAG